MCDPSPTIIAKGGDKTNLFPIFRRMDRDCFNKMTIFALDTH